MNTDPCYDLGGTHEQTSSRAEPISGLYQQEY